MRNLHELDKYRDVSAKVIEHYGSVGDGLTGVFIVPFKLYREPMRVIASAGEGWDHISISRKKRPPTWFEMETVKRLFFKEDETAFQLHVPVSDHINLHPYCLHIWRPHNIEIPRPPSWMVGPTSPEIQ